MSEIEKRDILSKVALGSLPPDTVITNGVLFDVFTGEFIRKQSVWIKDGRIAYVGPDPDPAKDGKTEAMDAEGRVLLPGLIDGHARPLSSRSGVEEFIKHVIPSGVTTVVAETIEVATIAGKGAIEFLAKGLEEQPIRFYYTLPPLCGLTMSGEGSAPSDEELLPFLKDSKCLGVDGISSCHEPMTEDEVVQRLRLGYPIMIREGSVRKELEGVKGVFRKRIDFRRLVLATGGVDPEGFLTEGYLDASLRSALKLGVSPRLAYQMVTLNVAEHFRLDHLIGSLSPGRMADVLVIPSPDDFSPQWVMCDGKLIYKDGKSLAEPQRIFFPDPMLNTVKIPAIAFPSFPKKGKIRAMELVTGLVTEERIIDLENPEESKDVVMILALDRRGSGKAFMGLLKNFGLQRGAYGATMSRDTADLIVAGCDVQSMETVIGRLIEIQGGGVYAIGKEVVAEFPAPLCGIVSLKPMEIVREEVRNLEASMRENGVKWEKPVLTVDTLGTSAIPHLRISHQGYVNAKDQRILSVEI